VVNNVGVNLNTASVSLLKYVSGINGGLARKIVKDREEKGKIASRGELITVPGMGPKSFEQSAGFLKIPESAESLDNTWVHPENYSLARDIREELQKGGTVTITGNLPSDALARIKEQFKVGDTTIKDIIEELKKPNRDPREDCPKPVMQKGVITFEDLHEGMTVTGKIKNVVDFGAFVDLGIKETALVHISELGNHYIKDPMEVVKVGEVLEFRIIGLDQDRRRISLSRKSGEQGTRDQGSGVREKSHGVRNTDKEPKNKEQVTVNKEQRTKKSEKDVRKPESSSSAPRSTTHIPRPKPQAEDDGTMYNPFAEAFKKMKK
jgi:uncharacterized protein